MNEIAVEEKLDRLARELRLAGDETERRLLELRAEIDRVKLELAAVKRYLRTLNPAFDEEFPRIKARTIEEFNPEFE